MMNDTGAAEGLVVFQRVKRTAGSGFDGVGVGTAWVAVDGPVARRDPDDLFTRPEPLFFRRWWSTAWPTRSRAIRSGA